MKTINIDKNSWHYKVATKAGNFDAYDNRHNNICAYTRSVLWGVAWLTSVVITLGGASILTLKTVVEAVLGILFSIMHGMWIFTEAGLAGLMIFAILGAVLSVLLIKKSIDARKRNQLAAPTKPSVVTEMYRSFKGKYCARLNFESLDN